MATCLEYHEQRTRQCEEWRDQGFDSCATWNPLFGWICVGWTWVTQLVCIGWVWTTSFVCVVWDAAVTGIDATLVTLEGIGAGWLLNLFAAAVEFVFVIPFIGPVLQWLWNAIILTPLSIILGAADLILYAAGVRPQKKLRVCTILFALDTGATVASVDDVLRGLNKAIEVYFQQMNVIVLRSAPFQYSTGFLHPPVADASWITVQPAGSQLTACCNECMAGEELTLKGSERKLIGMQACFWGNWRRLIGVGSPVVIFVIRNMEPATSTLGNGTVISGQVAGCGLGPLTDFVTVAATAPLAQIANTFQAIPDTTAHELGHICNLWHLTEANDVTNLMFSNEDGLTRNGTPLSRIDGLLFGWQAQLVRMSRHVSYL